MGNCLRHESSTQWGRDDQGPPVPDPFLSRLGTREKVMDVEEDEEEVLLGYKRGLVASNPKASRTKIKIKITKKQLEELLARVDVKESSVQQVLAQLANVGDMREARQGSTGWRPNLQSIPE